MSRNVKRRPGELVHPGEGFRRHANDGEIQAIQPNAASDGRWICRELVLPEIVREHDNGVPTRRLVLFGPESASELRFRAHDGEEIPAHQESIFDLRMRLGIFGETKGRQGIGGQSVERLELVPKIQVIGVRHIAESSARRARRQFNYLGRIRDG